MPVPLAVPVPMMPYSLWITMLLANTKPGCGRPSATMIGPRCSAVLCSMTSPLTPSRIWKRRPEPPQRGPPMSSKRLLAMSRRALGRLGRTSSRPSRLTPAPACRTTLLTNVTSSTVDHGARPSWLRTVKTIAKPLWAWAQARSKRLPSISTRRAFFSSNRFLTAHAAPANSGSPIFQASGLAKWLRRISMSDGTRSAMAGSAPPNITFSPAASR